MKTMGYLKYDALMGEGVVAKLDKAGVNEFMWADILSDWIGELQGEYENAVQAMVGSVHQMVEAAAKKREE